MRLQDTQAGCGPASMSNALAAMGVKRTPNECEALCGTTGTDGTPPARLIAGLRTVEGIEPVVLWEAREDVAILRLAECLRAGGAAVLLVDDDEHWVAAVGLLGPRILVADPADNELVLSYGARDLAERWRAGVRRPYYAVLVTEEG